MENPKNTYLQYKQLTGVVTVHWLVNAGVLSVQSLAEKEIKYS